MASLRVAIELPERKRQRMHAFDYREAGAYFVTICIDGRHCVLGAIREGTMRPSPIGTIVEQTWRDLPSVVPSIELDAFVLMPNHVHAVVMIRDAGARALSDTVRVFKSWSSRRVNSLRGTHGPFWQRGFYEHVVRNGDDLDRIRQYIRENPMTWAHDAENPERQRL